MRYAIARYQSQQRDLAYRIYVTDCLRMNIACLAGFGGGNVDFPRFADSYLGNKKNDETADDIIERIKNKLK